MGDPRNAMDIKPGYRGRAFTSDLTGQEFWLVVDKGSSQWAWLWETVSTRWVLSKTG